MYISWDDGASWYDLGLNLPTLQVSDIVVEENDLVIATHGRSFWVMYDMAPLRQLNPQVAASTAHLFKPVDPTRGIDRGVQVYYYLAEDVEELTMEFLDAAGNVVQTYEGTDERSEGGGGFGGFGCGFFGGCDPLQTADSHSFRRHLRYPCYPDFARRTCGAAGTSGQVAIPGRVRLDELHRLHEHPR